MASNNYYGFMKSQAPLYSDAANASAQVGYGGGGYRAAAAPRGAAQAANYNTRSTAASNFRQQQGYDAAAGAYYGTEDTDMSAASTTDSAYDTNTFYQQSTGRGAASSFGAAYHGGRGISQGIAGGRGARGAKTYGNYGDNSYSDTMGTSGAGSSDYDNYGLQNVSANSNYGSNAYGGANYGASNSAYSGNSYDAALYSAASSYLQQKANPMDKKAKWAALKKAKAPKPPAQQLTCEICKVSCPGPQAYEAHVLGQKHKKKETALKNGGGVTNDSGGASLRCEVCNVSCCGEESYRAHLQGAKHMKKINKQSSPVKATPARGVTTSDLIPVVEVKEELVGNDYIEEKTNETGKVIDYFCKLCDCHSNDVTVKEMHMRGRRHKLQYKKKVDPDYVVEMPKKSSGDRAKKDPLRQLTFQDDEMRLDNNFTHRPEGEDGSFWNGLNPLQRQQHKGMPAIPYQPAINRPFEDRHLNAKHAEIYPTMEELLAIQKVVANTEKALKLVSDKLAQLAQIKGSGDKVDDLDEQRLLKGVMRIGYLARGLLLKGDCEVSLVVLCGTKPTRQDLDKVASLLSVHFKEICTEEYAVKTFEKNASLTVVTSTEPKITVNISLTSPAFREVVPGQSNTRDAPNVLNRQKCLEALAELRHANWFKARALGLHSCVMLLRIFRDISKRLPVWNIFDEWALELLVERVLSSVGQDVSIGEGLRLVLEALASGGLLPGCPGLADPCEKEQIDVTLRMKVQLREDITASSQHALRLIAFKQVYKVLGMDPLPEPKVPWRFGRKRRMENEGGSQDGKKVRKADNKENAAMETS